MAHCEYIQPCIPAYLYIWQAQVGKLFPHSNTHLALLIIHASNECTSTGACAIARSFAQPLMAYKFIDQSTSSQNVIISSVPHPNACISKQGTCWQLVFVQHSWFDHLASGVLQCQWACSGYLDLHCCKYQR